MENMVNRTFLKEQYSGKRVFITGHTGFKGSWLTAWLITLGAVVKGYSLPPEPTHHHFAVLDIENKCKNVFDDIRNKYLLEKEIMDFNPDYIFHLAAQSLVKRSYDIPAETFDVNVIGTANILNAVRSLKGKCSVVV